MRMENSLYNHKEEFIERKTHASEVLQKKKKFLFCSKWSAFYQIPVILSV